MHTFHKIGRFAVLAACALSAAAAYGQTDTTGSVIVNVMPGVTISRNADTNWGRITAPPSGTATYFLDYSTGATSLTAGTGFCFSDGNAGDYTVTGSANATVAFSVSVGSFSGSGLTISSMVINGSTNSGTDTLDGSGNLDIKLGGYLDVDAAATVAQQTAPITLTVSYQ